MKKICIFIVLLLGVGLTNGWSASKYAPEEFHYIAIWGDVGYANLLNTGTLKTRVGCSPAVGVGYRYFRNGLVVQLGVEGQYMYFTQQAGDATITLKMRDTEGDPFELSANMREYKDVSQVLNVNVPLLLGYEYHHFYFLVGASLGMNVWSQAKANALMDTRASYSSLIDPFADMPNHQLQTGQSIASQPYRIDWKNPSVNALAEIGGRINRFNVAAFVEYGLTNVSSIRSDNEIISYRQESGQPLTFELLPVMKSNKMNDVRVNPLVVGVKVTYLLQLPGKSICVLCKD